jgi:hypothetical protein
MPRNPSLGSDDVKVCIGFYYVFLFFALDQQITVDRFCGFRVDPHPPLYLQTISTVYYSPVLSSTQENIWSKRKQENTTTNNNVT